MAVTVTKLRSLQVWDKWKAQGGGSLGTIPQLIDATASTSLNLDRLTVSFPLTSTAEPIALARRVLRAIESSSIFDEWMIIDRSTDKVRGIVTLHATTIRATEISESALVSRTDPDGVVVFDFESTGLTPAEHITQWVLTALAAQGITWVSLGTIEPLAPINLTFSWDSPLAVLLRIAEATRSELDLRRVGATGYEIDIIAKVNSTIPRADVRFNKNLVNIIRDEDTVEQATRIFARGAATEGHSTISRAEWVVTAKTGTSPAVVTLADPAGGVGPIEFDNQLANIGTPSAPQAAHLRTVTGTLTAVTASSRDNQTVTVASGTGITVGDLIQFRANSSGKDMVHLQDTAALTAYGVKVGIRDVPDVSGGTNVIPNPYMRDWTGTLPNGWTALGAPTITKQTAAPYTELGGASIKVQSTTDGQGVLSPAGAVFPTAASPYGSGYAHIWVVSGTVRVELVITTPTGTVIFPTSLEGVASNSVRGQWEDLGASGADLFAEGATAIAIRVVQHGSAAAVFYVDAAQASETASQEPLVEGSGGTRLWQEANEALRTGSLPRISYTVPLVDLEAIDPVVWVRSKLMVGGAIRVRDDVLNIDIETRLIQVDRVYTDKTGTSVILSNKFDDLMDLLAATPRPKPREPTGVLTDSFATVTPILSYKVSRPSNSLQATVQSDPAANVYRALARIDREPTGAEIDASTASPPLGKSATFLDLATLIAGKPFFVAGRAYNAAGTGSIIARKEGVYLGNDFTPGADIILGTIVPQPTQIIYPVAFDDECGACDIWIKEYTSDPGADTSVEGLAAKPYRTLTYGADDMVAGVAKDIAIPIAAPTNWLQVTFVPFDFLGKRGNVKVAPRTQGVGSVSTPGAPTVVALSSTSSTITNRVTLAAAINGFVRTYVDFGNVVDLPVTVGDGTVFDIESGPFEPNSTHEFQYGAVVNTVEALSNILTVSTQPGVTIDAPVINSLDYNTGDQAIYIYLTPGANTPPDSTYHIEADYALGWTEVSADILTVQSWGRPQQPRDVSWDLRARTSRGGYTTSGYSAVVSITVPAY